MFLACSGSVGNQAAEGIGDDAPTGAGGSSNSDPPCRVAVPMRRLTETQYRNAIAEVFKGQASLPADFALPKIGSPESGFSSDPNYNAVDLAAAREFNSASIEIPLSVVSKLGTLLPCSSSPSQECAQQFIEVYGHRAYRRPLEEDEKANLLKAFKLGTGADAFKDGIALVVSTMLQSPQFLYEYEVGEPLEDEPQVLRLKGHEVASRLSFMLWDSSPDEQLLAAAEAQELASAEGVRAQADRMLGDPRARASMIRFAREWAHFAVPQLDEKADEAYTQTLANAIQGEFDDFIARTFLDDEATLETLLTSGDGFGNETLAKFYDDNGGLGPRAGLLTQPALLAGLAGAGDTSPIRRSVFVRQRLTCEEFPPAPNDAADVEAKLSLPADATQRERSVARNKSKSCSGCHQLIDPLGFGFEAFDELGRHRTQLASGKDVDARGSFVDPVSEELAGDFETLPELGARLAQSPAVNLCFSRQLFRFSYGRLDGDDDRCSVQRLSKRVQDENLSLREFILGLVTADEFRFRRTQ